MDISLFELYSIKGFVAMFFFLAIFISSIGMPWSKKAAKEAEKKAEQEQKTQSDTSSEQ